MIATIGEVTKFNFMHNDKEPVGDDQLSDTSTGWIHIHTDLDCFHL